MENNIKSPVDTLLPEIATAVEEWKQANNKEKISNDVKELLDIHSQEIIMKLLGFNKTWSSDKWELDHCNGRNGNSAAGDFIRNAHSEAIKDWLTNVCLPDLNKATLTKLKKEAQKEYAYQIRNSILRLVRERAEADLKDVINKVVTPVTVESYLKAQELIYPKE